MIGQNFKDAPVHQRILSKSDHGTTRLISPIDGQSRLASARALTDFPIVIIATTTVSAALADWREQLSYLIAAAGLSVLVIAGMLFFVVRKLSQQHQDGKAASRHRRQQYSARPCCLRQIGTDYGLQPALHRDVRVVAGGGQAGLLHAGPDRASKGDRLFRRRRRRILRRDHAQCGARESHRQITEAPDGRAIQIINQPLESGGWVATIEDVTERKRSEERIAHLAHYDALTDLPNRALFHEQLEHGAQSGSIRRATGGALYRHRRIQERQRRSGTLDRRRTPEIGGRPACAVASARPISAARLGGDEFAVVQTAVKNPSETSPHLVDRIYRAIRAAL